MKNCNRDENICANEISLSKEEYIATVNAYSNSLTSEIVNVDCDSVSTIESIVTPYTESVTSNIESEVSMTSSALDRLQFSSENSSTTPYPESLTSNTESELTYTSSALEELRFPSPDETDFPSSIELTGTTTENY